MENINSKIDNYSFTTSKVHISGIRLSIVETNSDTEIGHSYIYILRNDIHKRPFAYLEDVYIEPAYRGSFASSALVLHSIDFAKRSGCYKIIGTVKHEHATIQRWYKNFGFESKANEVRINY